MLSVNEGQVRSNGFGSLPPPRPNLRDLMRSYAEITLKRVLALALGLGLGLGRPARASLLPAAGECQQILRQKSLASRGGKAAGSERLSAGQPVQQRQGGGEQPSVTAGPGAAPDAE
ncbi:hypothetical protein EYF80_006002 [Liparis tanakae]|uniref:Uncharacterized protein n=1 Tax=Liparis tanakae TaxID=230148 RepID=A0A4Z2J0Y6_9TELE|nr:hypothetical protein EYF80_006002 [Liparis tanakae]